MRTAVKGGNALESTLLATGAMPTPMVEGYMPAFGRALLVATEIGVFEALKDGARSAVEVAEACGTDARATTALLNLMVAMRYLAASSGTYRLRGPARRWLLADSPSSFRDAVLMKALEWRWIEHLDQFVRTGQSIDVHATLTPEEWNLYQRGMRAYAGQAASVIARFAPVPKGASTMLDIGGSHGYFSVALCRRHPALRATVFDLPGRLNRRPPSWPKRGWGTGSSIGQEMPWSMTWVNRLSTSS